MQGVDSRYRPGRGKKSNKPSQLEGKQSYVRAGGCESSRKVTH